MLDLETTATSDTDLAILAFSLTAGIDVSVGVIDVFACSTKSVSAISVEKFNVVLPTPVSVIDPTLRALRIAITPVPL